MQNRVCFARNARIKETGAYKLKEVRSFQLSTLSLYGGECWLLVKRIL